MSDTSIKDFEGAIAELESIVKKLEEGDLPLEQSLALYERGVQLSRFCHARLEDAEHRIENLGEEGGEHTPLPRRPPPTITPVPPILRGATAACARPRLVRSLSQPCPHPNRRCARAFAAEAAGVPGCHQRGHAVQRVFRREGASGPTEE